MLSFEMFERLIICIRITEKKQTELSERIGEKVVVANELVNSILKFMAREFADEYEYIYSWVYDCEEKQMKIFENEKFIFIDSDKDLYDYLVRTKEAKEKVIEAKPKKKKGR